MIIIPQLKFLNKIILHSIFNNLKFKLSFKTKSKIIDTLLKKFII